MRKLLSLLGALVVSATSATAVVACSNDIYSSDLYNPDYEHQDHSQDEQMFKAALVARAKSIVVNEQYGLTDSIAKNHMFKRLVSEQGTGYKDKGNTRTTINDVYGQNIDDNTLASAITGDKLKNEKFNIGDANTGQDGGVFEALENGGLDYIKNWLNDNVISKLGDEGAAGELQKILKSVVDYFLDAHNLNKEIGKPNLGNDIASALSPIMGVISNVNVPVAMTGVGYALGLIPDVSGNSLVSGVKWIFGQLKSIIGELQDPLDKALKNLEDATDISTLFGKDLSKITVGDTQDMIATILGRMVKNDYSSDKDHDILSDALSFGSLSSIYVTHIMENAADRPTSIKSSDLIGKTITDLTKDGKSINLAGLIRGVSYYISEGSADKIQYFMQLALLQNDGSKVSLNKIGQFVETKLQSLLGITDDLSDLMVGTLTDTENASVDSLFPDDAKKNGYFDYLMNGDWQKLKTIGTTDNGKIGQRVKDSFEGQNDSGKPLGMLNRVFWNDNTWTEADKPNLTNLLNAPLYKIFMMAGVKGYSIDDLEKNNGMLPNFAGAYSQSSILDLAKQQTEIVASDASLDSIKNNYFNFSNLQKLLDEILFKGIHPKYDFDNNTVSTDIDDRSFIEQFLDLIDDKDAPTKIAKVLGYNSALDNSDAITKKEIRNDSIMSDIVKMLMPQLDDDSAKPITLQEVSGSYTDNLEFFFKGLTPFLINMMKATDYSYWTKVMFDPAQKAWDYDGPITDEPFKGGFAIDKFANSNSIKAITLKLVFNPDEVDSVISHIPFVNKPDSEHKTVWVFKITRDNPVGKFSYQSIEKDPKQ